MAIPDGIQTLSAAFSLGILLQAAVSASSIFIKGHAKTIFQNSRRLVLVIFLTASALWAQVVFVSFTIPPTGQIACQATIIVSTVFDQKARIAIGGYLLWSVAHVSKSPLERYGLGTLLGLRVVAGTIFTVYTRPQFAPLCIAQPSLLPASIAVMGLDAVIIGVLMIRILTLGLLRKMRDVRSSTTQEQSRALVFGTLGFSVWTAASVMMSLGLPSVILLLRTAVPAAGLQVLVLVVSIYPGALVLPREEDSAAWEALSPVTSPSSRGLRSSNESNGSPAPHLEYSTRGNLFVVNPSNTPRDSPTLLPKILNDDGRAYPKFGGATVNTRGVSLANRSATLNDNRQSSGIFGTSLPDPLGVAASASGLSQLAHGSEPRHVDFGASTNILAPRDELKSEPQQKRSVFGRSKQPAVNVRKLGISKPIMNETQPISGSPFARMRTVDLATAAASERERRDLAQNMRLTATRPPPPPPLKLKGGSIVRKQAPPLRPADPFVPSPWDSQSSSLSVTLAASSTSASLSPGHEDLRRRSPRQPEAFGQERTVLKKLPFETNQNRAFLSQLKPKGYQIPNPQEQTVMLVNSIVYDNPGVVRSIIDGAPEHLSKEKDYDVESARTSSTIGSILSRPRPYRRQSEKDRAFFPSDHSPHNHRRSKSASSLLSRRSTLQSNSENLSAVPHLPSPPPTCASKLKRLLSADTRSMTVGEKISLLFPAPPGVTLAHCRRSSVPSIPSIPSEIVARDLMDRISSELDSQRHTMPPAAAIPSLTEPLSHVSESQRIEKDLQEQDTYRFSAKTYCGLAENIRESWNPFPKSDVVCQIPTRSPVSANVKFQPPEDSSDDETGAVSEWESLHSPAPVVRLMPTEVKARSLQISARKPSSPVGELVHSPGSGSTREFSPLPALSYVPTGMTDKAMPALSSVPTRVTNNEENGIVSIMLGGEREQRLSDVDEKVQSPTLNSDPILTPKNGGHWHRRIGDELLAFSDRRMRGGTCTLSPPTALILSSVGRQPAFVVRAPTPDSIDSPEKALQEIKLQLRNLDGYDQGPLSTLLRQMPETSASNPRCNSDAHLGLLANLEKEIGQQESQWQEMQHNFDRDSTDSGLLSPLPIPIPRPADEEFSERLVSEPATQRIGLSSSLTLLPKGYEYARVASPRSSDNSRASFWQRRLADAQVKYLDHTPEPPHKTSLNFLNFASGGQIGSPTPPDSLASGSDANMNIDADTDIDSDQDEESREHFPTTAQIMSQLPKAKTLWQPTQFVSIAQKAGHTWVQPQEIRSPEPSPEPPAKFLRPAPRKIRQPLKLITTGLWSIPATVANRPLVGLWGSRMTRPKSIVTRPKTQRPERRSRRMTILPDIVESPSPLPHKRETLGIFQFPWGEKSDSAVYNPPLPRYQSRSSFISVMNPTLRDRSGNTELAATEYPSSFFDEYDEASETDSDSDFDESTLWEIANILSSTNVPSRNSLLPPPRIIEDYDDEDSEEDSEEESDNEPPVKAPMVKFMPIRPLEPRPPKPTSPWMEDEDSILSTPTAPTSESPVLKSFHTPKRNDEILSSTTTPSSIQLPPCTPDEVSGSRASSCLWNGGKKSEESESHGTSGGKSATMWKTPDLENPAPIKDVSINKHSEVSEEPLSPVISNAIWNSATSITSPPQSQSSSPLGLWNEKPSPLSTTTLPNSAKFLWSASQQLFNIPSSGLSVASLGNDNSTSCEAPAAISTIRKPHRMHAELPALETQQLWSGKYDAPPQHHWSTPTPKATDSQ